MEVFKHRGTSPCGLREVRQLDCYGQKRSLQVTEDLPVSADKQCHVARVTDGSADVHLQDDRSSQMCGVPGAPVPWADQSGAGVSTSPNCCIEEVVRADVCENLQGYDNCDESKGACFDVWLESYNTEDEDAVTFPKDIPVSLCGALGVPVLLADLNGIGHKSGPDVHVARVVSADVCGNLQGDNNSEAGKGVPEVVLQEGCKIQSDGDVGTGHLAEEDHDVGCVVSTGTGPEVMLAGGRSQHAQRDTCPWYWFWRPRVDRDIQFQCFKSPVTKSVAGPHCAQPGTWALCGYWGCSRRVPFHGPGPPTTACVP